MKKTITIALASFMLVACGGGGDKKVDQSPKTQKENKNTQPNPTTPSTDNQVKKDGTSISTTIPSNLGAVYNSTNFNRYTSVKTPNGGSIHIVAQDKITNEQIIRCRNILKHYLTDFKGSMYGSDKSAIANNMAKNGAILALLNGQDDGSNPLSTKVTGQPLYQNEIQVEGGAWYMAQNYEHRDAAYEEILHLVHDKGIGVDGAGGSIGAAPEYQAKIREAQQNALTNNLWAIGTEASKITEWRNENSLSQEYLASVVDSYYGLWGAYTQSGSNGMWGMYVGKTREDTKTDDPMGYALMGQFFHPYITYNAQISASLNGNFSLKFDSLKPYTNHSRYLKDVTLLGSNNNSVSVNELDNIITGNSGINTVIFSGNSSEYDMSKSSDGTAIIIDNLGRDGKNKLYSIEKLQFNDKTMDL
ncbi:MAG: hypothetical protein CR967_00675 [Proteobacteria bacterium]|nr:MAG: hypothetical protein CR967_00675 [Pseudomonadota bacterium]